MKITPKVPKSDSITNSALVDGKKIAQQDALADERVFSWNPSKMSYEAPNGEIYICSVVQNGDPESTLKQFNIPTTEEG